MAQQKPNKGPEFTFVDPNEIRFDESNPRFGGEAKRLSQGEIQRLLEEAPYYALELLDSFVENGFIAYEPLVVRKENGKFVVIEGNRRLAAVRHILDNAGAFSTKVVAGLRSIPVLIFREKQDATERDEVRTYLGVRHLLGYREWPPESKAIFLDQHIRSASDLRRLVKELGIPKSSISRLLVPYRVKKAARDVLEGFENIEDKKFWTLGEALTRSGIKEYIKLEVDSGSLKVVRFDKARFTNLLEFLYGSAEEGRRGTYRALGRARITETRDLTRLARVLSRRKAAERLEKGATLEDAEMYVETREETVQGLIDELRVLLQKIISLQPTPAETQTIAGHFRSFSTAVRAFEE